MLTGDMSLKSESNSPVRPVVVASILLGTQLESYKACSKRVCTKCLLSRAVFDCRFFYERL